ncbi:MAG: large conductance mechanosensitive channel protein MscL [Fimbriimonadales bacterium]
MSVLSEFKAFAIRGNMIDLVVGVILGAAFTTVVNALVNEVIMPPLGLLVGEVDFGDLFVVLREGNSPGPYSTVGAAEKAEAVTLNYGRAINSFVAFFIVSFVVFLLVKAMNRMRQRIDAANGEPATQECPFCITQVSSRATRCPQCTSELATTPSP